MRPRTNAPFKNSKKPQVVVNQYPESQDEFGRGNIVPGQQTYAIVTRTPQEKTTNYNEINYQKYLISCSHKRNKIFVVVDNDLSRNVEEEC